MTSADPIIAVIGRKGAAVITGFSIGPLLSPLPLVFAVYAACRPHSKEAAVSGAALAFHVSTVTA